MPATRMHAKLIWLATDWRPESPHVKPERADTNAQGTAHLQASRERGGLMPRAPFSHRDLSIPRFALRCEEAAASVGISQTKFKEWESDGRMPKGRKIDGVVLYDTQEVFDAWRRLRDGEFPNKNPFDGVTA